MTIDATNGDAAPPRQISAWRNIFEILAIIVGVLIGSLIGYFTGFLPAESIFAMLVPILFATVFLKRRGQSWRELGLRKPKRPDAMLIWAVVATLGGALLSILASLVAGDLGAPPAEITKIVEYVQGNFIHYLWFLIAIAWFSAGFGEEMIARGFLLNRFEQLFGFSKYAAALAVIAQAALFAAAHSYQGITGMLSTSAIALVFGFVYLKSGRLLWPTIIAHAAIDSFGITMLYLGNFSLM